MRLFLFHTAIPVSICIIYHYRPQFKRLITRLTGRAGMQHILANRYDYKQEFNTKI